MELRNKQEEQKVAWYKAETDRIKALSDHEVDATDQSIKAISMILNKDSADLDRDGKVSLEEKKMAQAAKTPAQPKKDK